MRNWKRKSQDRQIWRRHLKEANTRLRAVAPQKKKQEGKGMEVKKFQPTAVFFTITTHLAKISASGSNRILIVVYIFESRQTKFVRAFRKSWFLKTYLLGLKPFTLALYLCITIFSVRYSAAPFCRDPNQRSDKSVSVIWSPVAENEVTYMDIDKKWSMKRDFFKDRMAFWEEIYESLWGQIQR